MLKKALEEKSIFQRFLENILVENTVLLLPCSSINVSYRDEYPGFLDESGERWQGFGSPLTKYSVLGGVPCVSFPVGQSPYQSKISKREEYQPVSMMLIGAAGTDEYLIDLIKYVLELSGRPTGVKTGKVAYEA